MNKKEKACLSTMMFALWWASMPSATDFVGVTAFLIVAVLFTWLSDA